MEKTQQRPEGQLLADLRAAHQPRLSVRAAAELADISEARWRQIESGYATPSKGTQVPVEAPADTLAAMAIAIGGTPEDLRAYGRPDAADAAHRLTQALQRSVNNNPLRHAPIDDLLAELRRRATEPKEQSHDRRPATTQAREPHQLVLDELVRRGRNPGWLMDATGLELDELLPFLADGQVPSRRVAKAVAKALGWAESAVLPDPGDVPPRSAEDFVSELRRWAS